MSIPLPPPPRLPDGWWKDKVTESDMEAFLRARDQEIVRCVLEAAAKVCGPYSHGQWFADKIRKLEFHHE